MVHTYAIFSGFIVRGAILCVSTIKKGYNDQQKKKNPSQKTTPTDTVELLDFRVKKSVIFRCITREIAHQPATERSGTSPDPTRLNAAELLLYVSLKMEVKSSKNRLFWGYFHGMQANLHLMRCNRVKQLTTI